MQAEQPRDRAAERVDWNRVGHSKVKQILLELDSPKIIQQVCSMSFWLQLQSSPVSPNFNRPSVGSKLRVGTKRACPG